MEIPRRDSVQPGPTTGQCQPGPSAAAWALVLSLVPLGWIAGVALQLQQRQLLSAAEYQLALAAAALLGLLGGGLLRRFRPSRAVALMLVWLLAAWCGAWGSTGLRALDRQASALSPQAEGVDLELTGVIADLPDRSGADWRFPFLVEQARHDGKPIAVPPRLQLSWYGSGWGGTPLSPEAYGGRLPPAQGLRAGDRWRLTARLRAPHGNVNPHGFDYELWMWQRGLGAAGYVRTTQKTAPPQRLARGQGHAVARMRQTVRDRILQRLAPDGSAEDLRRRSGIVAALATGDQRAIDREDWDIFRITGVAHLVSISGLHISMIAWLGAQLAGLLWRLAGARRRRLLAMLPAPQAALLGGLVLGLVYAVFSGWGVPAQRTTVMLACVILLRVLGLRWPWWLTWLWACAAVLVVDPWAFLQAGFWLSFVAIGILFATDIVREPGAAPDRRLHIRALALVQAQGAVTLALAPLTLILFGQASVIGLLANLVAIPWVTMVVTPTALGGVLLPWSWQVAEVSLRPLILWLQWLAQWPGAQLLTAAAPLAIGIAAALGGLLLVLRWPLALRLGGLPLFLPLLLWQPARPLPGQFDLLAADIGQGNAVLVRTASHSLLYDTGPRYSRASDAGARVLVPLLRALGERPARIVISHRDADHSGGAGSIVQVHPQAQVLAALRPGETVPGLQTWDSCVTGLDWDWDGVRFQVLHPTAGQLRSAQSSNAVSCVLRISSGTASVLLAGDLEAPQERTLVAGETHLASDLLLVPHHGSKTSSTDEFLRAVAPRVALVQSGYRNRYGHPAAPVVQRYEEHGIALYKLPRCGAMHWDSQAPSVVDCERERSRRYWRFDALRPQP